MPQETFSKGTNTEGIIRTEAKWYQFGVGMLHGCNKQSALKHDLVSINFGNIYRDDAVILWKYENRPIYILNTISEQKSEQNKLAEQKSEHF